LNQETYLFKAACSELKTEIQNNRKAEADTWRSQRALLQHEVDILGQNMTQDISSLKDELRGLFDDRKMAVRMEQKRIEAKVRDSIGFA
jgi:coiled-coil family 90 protein